MHFPQENLVFRKTVLVDDSNLHSSKGRMHVFVDNQSIQSGEMFTRSLDRLSGGVLSFCLHF